MQEIIQSISKQTGLTINQIKSRSRRHELITARMVFVYLAFRSTKRYSTIQIGDFLNRNHATIYNAQDQIRMRLNQDEKVFLMLLKLVKDDLVKQGLTFFDRKRRKKPQAANKTIIYTNDQIPKLPQRPDKTPTFEILQIASSLFGYNTGKLINSKKSIVRTTSNINTQRGVIMRFLINEGYEKAAIIKFFGLTIEGANKLIERADKRMIRKPELFRLLKTNAVLFRSELMSNQKAA